MARSNHASTLIEDKYLVIYGGRNDTLYKSGDVALKDLVLFDLKLKHWVPVF